jgi:putative phage-type endonuclease
MNYPDCTLIDCDQRTDEWFAARKGCLTASNFGAWLTKSDKTSAKARSTAIAQVLAEVAGFPDPPIYENADIKRGIEWEDEALQYFQKLTGLTVDPIGFAKSKHGHFGCSPDGLILSNGSGVEVKCPRASKLIEWFQAGILPDAHRDQVHGSMAVTGAKEWHFIGYHRGLPAFHILTLRDEYTESILDGLKAFSKTLETASEIMTLIASNQASKIELAPQ